MNIVIAGGGVVGQSLARELSQEGMDIVLIEEDEELLDQVIGRVDITGLAGNAASYENLMEAGVAEADLFISVTSSDEINLISAIMAKRIGARHTIVRVRNPEYTHHADFMRQDLGISLIINPEQAAAQDIVQTIRFKEANSVEYFANHRVTLLELTLRQHSSLTGMSIKEFGRIYQDILVVTVDRGDDQVFVPSGELVLEEGDEIYVIGSRQAIHSFYKEAGFSNQQIHSAMIIGESQVAYYLVDLLSKNHIDVKMVCRDYESAKTFSESFPKATVVYGDITDQDFLKDERISYYDMVLSLSRYDEENIINSLYAQSMHVDKVITQVTNINMLKILGELELQSIVTPKHIMANQIQRFVMSLNNSTVSRVEHLIRIANQHVQVMQFLVKEDSKVVDIPLYGLQMQENTLVAFITRGQDLIIPRGRDSIQVGDHVIIVTTDSSFEDVDDILIKRKEE